jgi:hypothetical protein
MNYSIDLMLQLNKYAINSLAKLINEYAQFSINDILNIMNDNGNLKDGSIIINKIPSYFEEIFIFFTTKTYLVVLQIVYDEPTRYEKIIIKNNFDIFIKSNELIRFDIEPIFEKVFWETTNPTPILLNELNKYSIKAYNIFFTFCHSGNFKSPLIMHQYFNDFINLFPKGIKILCSSQSLQHFFLNIKN